MSYDVLSLIDPEKPDVITADKQDTVKNAVRLMIKNNYSQLPIVNEMNSVEGVISIESIIRSLRSINTTLDQLRVIDAKAPVEKVKPDAEITKCLEILQRDNVAIIEENGQMVQIITTYDALEFFQKKSQDMLWVEDIESSIKDLIENATFTSDGETDQDNLESLVERVTKTGEEQKYRIKSLLSSYIEKKFEQESQVDYELLEELLEEYLPTPESKSFDELSFFDYTQLLLIDDIWKHYEKSFTQGKDQLNRMLDRVRRSRNFLAHFKGELPIQERDHLKFMKDWLSNQEVPESIYLPVGDVAKDDVHQVKESSEEYDRTEEIEPTDETPIRKKSKYAPLAAYLYSQSGKYKRLELSFAEIEEIIIDDLPLSAREHSAWWANDSVGHSHSIQWLNAGWRVSYKNLSDEKVTFVRIKGRERAYIEFFSKLRSIMEKSSDIPLKNTSPNGANWLSIAKVPKQGKQQAVFAFSFTWEKKFRVELYIDTGDKKQNKEIFDEIQEKMGTVKINGEAITWERIPEKRASRIAVYKDGSIDQSPEKLNILMDWASKTMLDFYLNLYSAAEDAISSISN